MRHAGDLLEHVQPAGNDGRTPQLALRPEQRALLVDPLDTAALADALRLVLTDDDLRAGLQTPRAGAGGTFHLGADRAAPLAVYRQAAAPSDAEPFQANASAHNHLAIGTTMNILHIYKDYPPILGGIENHVQLLAQGQAAAGHAVTVLVTNPAGRRTTVTTEHGVA